MCRATCGGATGDAVSTQALVLTAIKLGQPSKPAIFARDADTMAASVQLGVTLNKPADVGWRVLDADGAVVRTVRPESSAPSGKLTFAWDGRADDGAWVPDGWYRSVVTATTRSRLVRPGANGLRGCLPGHAVDLVAGARSQADADHQQQRETRRSR